MIETNEILRLGTGETSIEIWTIWARLNAAYWHGSDNLLDGSATPDEARNAKLNHGSVVGPVANRIAGASFDLDGQTYSFEANEGADTLLHSGRDSLRSRNWNVAEANATAARLTADVPHLADGFPGNRRFEARYRVVEDGFELTLSARTDTPTLVNLALHPYWRLDAGGREGLLLLVNADRYLPIDKKKIPTGEIADVAGTAFDLRKIDIPGDHIDHNYCLPKAGNVSAILSSAHLQVHITTDAPGLQVFTGKPIGIALEPQHWPDAPHHPNFPSIRLDPARTYRQSTSYRFSRP